MKFILFYCLLFMFHLSLISQEPYYRTLSTEDGLPSNTVHTVFTDSKGYIWFGTPNGAVRWDSKNFKTYTIEDGLPNNEVLGFFEDSRGRLWISTFSNELCYLQDKVIYSKRNDKRLGLLYPIVGGSIFQFKNHLIYPALKNNIILNIETLDSISYLNSNNYYYSFSELNNKLLGYNWLGKTPNYTLFETSNKCYDGLRIMVKNMNKIDNSILKSQFKTRSLMTNSKYNFTNINDFFVDSILSSNYLIKNSFKNRSNFSLTELNNMLFVLDYELKFYSNYNKIILFNKTNTLKILNFKNELKLLTNNSLIDLKDNKIIALKTTNFYNIDEYKNKTYIASSSNQVNIISNKNISNLIQETPDFNNFKHVYYNEKRNFNLIGTGKFLLLLKTKKLKILDSFKTYCSYIDTRNRLWYSGLNRIYFQDNFNNNIVDKMDFKLDSSKSIFVKEIKEDKLRNIFFTTNDGIYIYDKNSNIKYNLSKSNFLTSNECSHLIIDSIDNSLWVTTPVGLNHIKYYYKNKRLEFQLINRFLKDDGLPSNEINDIMIQGDSVYIATPKGLSMIADKNYRPDTISIPIYINTLKVNDSLIHYDSSIYLMPNQNNLELDYSAIYYLRRDRLTIRYKLIRNGDTSIYDLTDTKIRLNALNSGEYQLIISAFDLDYPYINGESKIYKFTIKKPFYQSWWFYLLGIVALSFVSFMYYKRKLNRIQQINHYEKKFSQLKLEALKAEMNPHFIFNCLSAIKDYILKADIEKSQYYLSKLAKLIRLALYNSKDEFVKLSDEINFIDIYIELERMRFDDKFDFIKDFNTDNFNHIQIPTMILQPFFENAIRHGKIGQLEFQGKLYFNVFEEENYLVFDIRDNGIGIEAAHKQKESTQDNHRSMAIDIINERIEIYNHSYNLDIKYKMNSLENNEYKTQVLVYLNLSNL